MTWAYFQCVKCFQMYTTVSLSEPMGIEYASFCDCWSFYCNWLIFVSFMKRINCFLIACLWLDLEYLLQNVITFFILVLFCCMLKWEWLLIFYVHYIFVFWMGVMACTCARGCAIWDGKAVISALPVDGSFVQQGATPSQVDHMGSFEMIDNFGQQDGFESGGLTSGKFWKCSKYEGLSPLCYLFDLYINVTLFVDINFVNNFTWRCSCRY